MSKYAGSYIEFWYSKNLYEPLYGTPEKIEDFTREHCAMIEDSYIRMCIKFAES